MQQINSQKIYKQHCCLFKERIFERTFLTMTMYYILIGLIFGLAVPACFSSPSRKKTVIYVCSVFGVMLLMIALRYDTGNDYYNYRRYLYSVIDGGMSVGDIIRTYSVEPGYALLLRGVASAFPRDCAYLALNAICAVLTVCPAAYAIIRYSKMPWLSAWLYVAITILYNAMNFTRQSIAAAIVFMGYGFFVRKNHIGVLAVILAGAMFHFSVLIMIPVYLVTLIKPTPLSLGIIGGAGLLVFIFSNQLITFVLTNFFPKYSQYLGTVYLTVGLTPKFLIVPAALMIIIMTAFFLGWKKAGRAAEMQTFFIFINFLLWLFIVKHFIVERFTLPMYIFTLISLPEALEFYRGWCSELSEKLGENKKEAKSRKKNARTQVRYRREKKLAARYLFPGVTALTLGVTFWYNLFCIGQGVHGVFPYKSVIYPMWTGWGEVNSKLEKNPPLIYVNLPFTEFTYLAKEKDFTLVALVNGSSGDTLEWVQKSNLKSIGMEDFFDCTKGESFIGVYSKGKAVFEMVSDNEVLRETVSLYDGKYSVTAVSAGANSGGVSSLTVNGVEFLSYPESEGVFFAVFDNVSKKLKTAQGYGTGTYNQDYIHSNGFNGLYYREGFEDLEPVYDE